MTSQILNQKVVWFMKKFLFFSLMVSLLAFASFGCKPDNAATNAGSKPTVQASQNVFAEITDSEITDSEKRKVILAKKPERVVVMVPSILNYVDAVGGTIIGRPSSSKASVIPPSMEKAEDVGHVFNINMETRTLAMYLTSTWKKLWD